MAKVTFEDPGQMILAGIGMLVLGILLLGIGIGFIGAIVGIWWILKGIHWHFQIQNAGKKQEKVQQDLQIRMNELKVAVDMGDFQKAAMIADELSRNTNVKQEYRELFAEDAKRFQSLAHRQIPEYF